ncbi:MAG: tyrosine-type recombinase/integrase [Caulobacteraceae bacterium]
MANVRKVLRPRSDGTSKVIWRAAWLGADGKRQSKSFAKKGDADAWLREIAAGRNGGSATMTIAELGSEHFKWFDGLVKAGVREAVTRDGYATALDRHVRADAAFARTRLCDLTTPKIQSFLDNLFASRGSVQLTKRVRRTLVTWCSFGQRKGWLTANPAQACKVEETARLEDDGDAIRIPPKAELGQLLAAAEQGDAPERDVAVFRLLMFSGLRISELLGLADDALIITGKIGRIRVRERLERRYRVLGASKSAKSRRGVPIGETAALAVKAWRLKRGVAPAFSHAGASGPARRVAGRLFPSPDGEALWGYDDFMRECWVPTLNRAGFVDRIEDARGKKRSSAAYGPHTLRHVAASLWIAQGLKPKKIQELLGHSTLQLTMDLYGHLWRDDAEDEALAAASEALIVKPAV